MKKFRALSTTILSGLAILAAFAATAPASAAEPGFTFAAVGDNGDDVGAADPGNGTSRTLHKIGETKPAFVQSLGDLAYDPSADVRDGGQWCDWTAARIADTSGGTKIPYIIAAGNHEAQDAEPGFAIEDYMSASACADPFSGSTVYPKDAATDAGKDSYYDYPTAQPLLRVININPGLTFRSGGLRDYTKGGALYSWVSTAIDQAKARGEWVAVTYHVPFLNSGSDHGADMTGYYAPTASQFGDVYTLVVEKKVDLILNGHEHNYQRSAQLHLGGTCPQIAHDAYNAACVGKADGSDAAPYVRGEGPVQLIIGTGGHKPSTVNNADADRPYMLVADDGADNCGYVSFAVTAAAITGTFENACSGSLADRFTIVGSAATASPSSSASASSTARPTPSASASVLSPLMIGIIVGGIALVLVVAAIVVIVIRRRA